MANPVSMRVQILLLGALVGIAAAVWIAMRPAGDAVTGSSGNANQKLQKSGEKKPGRDVPVIVVEVGQVKNDEIVAAVGTARARRSVTVQAETDGEIVAFGPRAGAAVKKGDSIVRLDDTKARLAVEIATRRLEEVSRLHDRSKFLQQSSVNSSAKVQDSKTVVERTSLELQQAREALLDLNIKAPFDGVIGIPKVEVGDRVTTATAIVSLDMRSEILVEFEVAEKFLARIAAGDAVAAVTPSHSGRTFSGRIENIDSRIDPASRTVAVRAVIPNDHDLLRPGMSFAVELVLPGEMYPAVPELSLQWRKGESYVWVARDGRVIKTLVRTVKRLNSIILVDADLKPGQLVVVEGVQRLRHGRAVSYTRPKPEAKPATVPETRRMDPAKDNNVDKG